MTTFFMFGKYTPESVRQVSIERTQQAVAAIKGLGGEVTAMHVLLVCVSLPGIEQAVQASVTLSRLTGIGFTTCPAVAVETFDRIVTGKGL
jgi:hypothetical protein